MRIGTGCPADNFYWQSGSLKPEFLLLQKQLIFVHHLANLPVGSLGRDVHDLQVSHSLPGLATSLQEHLNTLGVSNLTVISKVHWKKEIKIKMYGIKPSSTTEFNEKLKETKP